MFPVPDHLPKTGGDYFSTDRPRDVDPEPDPTLDLLQPLLDAGSSTASRKGASGGIEATRLQADNGDTAGPSRWSSGQVRAVRESLEKAITANKVGYTLRVPHPLRVRVQLLGPRDVNSKSLRMCRALLMTRPDSKP